MSQKVGPPGWINRNISFKQSELLQEVQEGGEALISELCIVKLKCFFSNELRPLTAQSHGLSSSACQLVQDHKSERKVNYPG